MKKKVSYKTNEKLKSHLHTLYRHRAEIFSHPEYSNIPVEFFHYPSINDKSDRIITMGMWLEMAEALPFIQNSCLYEGVYHTMFLISLSDDPSTGRCTQTVYSPEIGFTYERSIYKKRYIDIVEAISAFMESHQPVSQTQSCHAGIDDIVKFVTDIDNEEYISEFQGLKTLLHKDYIKTFCIIATSSHDEFRENEYSDLLCRLQRGKFVYFPIENVRDDMKMIMVYNLSYEDCVILAKSHHSDFIFGIVDDNVLKASSYHFLHDGTLSIPMELRDSHLDLHHISSDDLTKQMSSIKSLVEERSCFPDYAANFAQLLSESVSSNYPLAAKRICRAKLWGYNYKIWFTKNND